MAGDHDHLGIGRQGKNLLEERKALGNPAGIRRQTQIQRHHRRLQPAQVRNGALAVLCNRDLEIFKTPLQLALQARVVFNNQEFVFAVCH